RTASERFEQRLLVFDLCRSYSCRCLFEHLGTRLAQGADHVLVVPRGAKTWTDEVVDHVDESQRSACRLREPDGFVQAAPGRFTPINRNENSFVPGASALDEWR